MPIKNDPGVYRRQIRVELREARRVAGLTQQDAATALEWSLSKLIRIETASVGISITDMRALIALYQIEIPEKREILLDAARKSRGRPWWHDYQDLIHSAFAQLLAFENISSLICTYSPTVITALLQIREYATALRTETVQDANRRVRLVDLLMSRQELFDSPEVLHAAFVVDEAALRRLIGGPAVMRKQLLHLRQMMERPNVSIHILPFTAGAHGALGGPFVLLEAGDGGDDIVFFEGAEGDTIAREDHDLHAYYSELFARLTSLALRDGEDVALLDKLISEYAHA